MGFERAAISRSWPGTLPAMVLLLAVAAWTAGPRPASPGAGTRLSPTPVEAAVLIEGLGDRANGADADSRRSGDGGCGDARLPNRPAGHVSTRTSRGPAGLPGDTALRRLERAGRLGHPSTAPPSPS